MGSEPAFWLPANAPASILARRLDTEGTGLVALHLTNCQVADPADLVRLATRCEKLRALMCVASRVKAGDLLCLMLGPLQLLSRLELSMVDDDEESTRQLVEVLKLSGGEFRDAFADNLRCMYVEVAGDANIDLVEAFVERCPNVINFHVHFIGTRLLHSFLRFFRIMKRRPLMDTFTFTSEVPLSTPDEPASENLYIAITFANVVFRSEPRRLNIFLLQGLVTSTEQLRLPGLSTVVAVCEPSLEAQIERAGFQNNWSGVRFLNLILLPADVVVGVPHARASCIVALSRLFRELKNLTELNVNSFHFGPDCDLTQVLDHLQDLQALSLPPCCLQHFGALRRLAQKCTNLEDLDIRAGPDGRTWVCRNCTYSVFVNPADTAALSVSHSNGRLTLSVCSVLSLAFSATCKMAELRIFDHSLIPHEGYMRLGQLLSNNKTLRVLVLQYTGLNFATHEFKVDIAKASTLRYLCLLSDVILIHAADAVLRSLAGHFPRVQAIHAHYRDYENVPQQVSWSSTLPHPVGWHGHAAAAETQYDDYATKRKPCILCSTHTFIGLAKPHNRGRKTNL